MTRTGTGTIDLGPAPAAATDVSLTLTCLSPGTFYFPDGSSTGCSAADIKHPPVDRQAIEVVPLRPGQQTVTIETSASASWTLQAVYVDRVPTPWATNASGETYGVPDQNGTPDLVAAVIDHGSVQGYVKTTDLDCASGQDEVHSPSQALAWDEAEKDRDISTPVYESNGRTVIGVFVVGRAAGPGARTVPLSEPSVGCQPLANGRTPATSPCG